MFPPPYSFFNTPTFAVPARAKILFRGPLGNDLTREELIVHLELRQESIRQACNFGCSILINTFKVPPVVAQPFSQFVFDAITAGTPQAIASLKQMGQEPETPARPRFTAEHLIEAQNKLNDAEARLEQIKNVEGTLPEAVQELWKAMVHPMLEEQVKSAQQWRDYVQQELEAVADQGPGEK